MPQPFASATRASRSFCILTAAIMLFAARPLLAADKQSDEETLQKANLVLSGMFSGNTIPAYVIARSKCVVVLPGVRRFGFGGGGSGGGGPRSGGAATTSMADGPPRP